MGPSHPEECVLVQAIYHVMLCNFPVKYSLVMEGEIAGLQENQAQSRWEISDMYCWQSEASNSPCILALSDLLTPCTCATTVP